MVFAGQPRENLFLPDSVSPNPLLSKLQIGKRSQEIVLWKGKPNHLKWRCCGWYARSLLAGEVRRSKGG